MSTPPASLDDLKKGLNVPHDSGHSPSVPPAWLTKDVYDPVKIKAFYEKYHFALVFCWNVELAFGFAFKEILSCLVYTGESSTPKTSLARYKDTFAHYTAWHSSDIFDPTTDGYTSLQGVRSWHAVVEKDMEKDKPGSTWISSFAMAVVQCGSAAACTTDRLAGFFGLGRASQQELEEYLGFWRCVAYQLGLDDRFNVFGGGRDLAAKLRQQITDEVLIPDNEDVPPEWQGMVDAYIDGCNLMACKLPICSAKSSLAYMYMALGKKLPFKLGFGDWLRLGVMGLLALYMNHLPGVCRLLSWASLRSCASAPSAAGCPYAKARAGTHACAVMPAAGHAAPSSCRRCCCSPLTVVILVLLLATAMLAAAVIAGLLIGAHSLLMHQTKFGHP